jgi:FKBP-type peptidyl-prolyl cis-trans isomerase FkpA
MINKLLSIVLVLSVLTLSCKKETRTLKEVQDQEIQNFLGASISSFTKDTSGIYYQILAQPTGNVITNTEQIYYYQNIKTADGVPLLNTDKYNYIKAYLTDIRPTGFNKTIFALAKKGGKIRSIIPAYLAYGKDGSGSIVKGNALIDATFEVINAETTEAAEDSIITNYKKKLPLAFTRDASGVYYSIINPGNGAATYLTSTLSVNYTGKFFNGVQFDASAIGTPLVTSFDPLIKGWQTLTKIKKGGKIRLLIPSYKAYSTTDNGTVPSNCPLDFEIELVDVK